MFFHEITKWWSQKREEVWLAPCFQRAGVHLGRLCLLLPVFCLQAAFLPQSRGQRRLLGVQQGLEVFEPLRSSSQVGLLLGVPAGAQRNQAVAVWSSESRWTGEEPTVHMTHQPQPSISSSVDLETTGHKPDRLAQLLPQQRLGFAKHFFLCLNICGD